MDEGPSERLAYQDRDVRRASNLAIRLAFHVVGIAPFVIATIIESVRGWRPVSDDAIITLRSWDVLTTHIPLVGQHSNVTSDSSHAVYGAGPLLYWLLTIPVHIDHSLGALWGAALLCMVGVSLAIEAAWSARTWIGAAGVVVIVVLLAALHPEVVLDPVWNPSVGVIWYLTTAAAAWAVACGRFGWTPVLVLAGSLAAQCHLVFAVAALGSIILAPVLGLVLNRRPARWRWLWASVAVAVACWAGPIVQQVTARPGNLSLIATSGHGDTVGLAFGLKALVNAVSPHSLVFVTPTAGFVPTITSQSILTAVAILVALVAVAIGAWATGRYGLSTLAFVALVFALAGAWSVGEILPKLLWAFGYLDRGLWISAMLIWAVLLWAIAAIVYRTAQKWHATRHWLMQPRPLVARLGSPVRISTMVAAAGAASFLAVWLVGRSEGGYWQSVVQYKAFAGEATPQVEHLVTRGPVNVVPGDVWSVFMLPGVLWRLRSDGRVPKTASATADELGPAYVPTRGSPRVALVVSGGVAVRLSGS